jgi:predicted Zn-dependent protease with MMP-like domain
LPDDALCEEIRRTVLHELAHYFGLDDDYLDEIGWG